MSDQITGSSVQLVAERVKGTSSSFLPYLQSLPSGIPGLPIFFRPGEVQQLQYPPLVQQVNLRCRWLIKFASEAVTSEIEGRSFSGTAVDANLLGESRPGPDTCPWQLIAGRAVSSQSQLELCRKQDDTLLQRVCLL